MLNPAPERLCGQRRGRERRDAPEGPADGVRPRQNHEGLRLAHVVSHEKSWKYFHLKLVRYVSQAFVGKDGAVQVERLQELFPTPAAHALALLLLLDILLRRLQGWDG